MSYLDRFVTSRRLLAAAVATLGLMGAAGGVGAQTTLGNAATGQSLYATYCAGCHQMGGPTNPAAGVAKVQNGTTATVLQAAIASPLIPAMSMNPNLTGLSSVQVADISAYIAADIAANGSTPPPATPTGDSTAGRALYASACAGCHGPAPADGAARANFGVSASVIQAAITNFPQAMGRVNLSSTQLNDVAAFIAADVAAKTGSSPVERGRVIYAYMCSSCHGGDPHQGQNDIGKATSGAKTISAIRKNKGGMAMLSYVTADQMNDVAAYVSTTNPKGEFDLGGCTLGRADQPTDPLWLLMLFGAGWVLRVRRAIRG